MHFGINKCLFFAPDVARKKSDLTEHRSQRDVTRGVDAGPSSTSSVVSPFLFTFNCWFFSSCPSTYHFSAFFTFTFYLPFPPSIPTCFPDVLPTLNALSFLSLPAVVALPFLQVLLSWFQFIFYFRGQHVFIWLSACFEHGNISFLSEYCA